MLSVRWFHFAINSIRPLLTLLLLLLTTAQSQPRTTDVDAVRAYYLDPLILPSNYAPGKNSFLLQNLHRGDRRTVLELEGAGSVRHIWSTWSVPGDDSDVPAPGWIVLRAYVDGESSPSIEGPLDELCRAAEATGDRYVPMPAFNYKGAFNFYLPIYFAHRIRIEIEAEGEIQEFYTQIDYRSENAPESRARLFSKGDADGLKLRYRDRIPNWATNQRAPRGLIQQSRAMELGSRAAELTIAGPGILRELRFRGKSLDDLELQIFWDSEVSPSVQAPLRYLFADFHNAALNSSTGQSVCYFRMPFRKRARLLLRSISGAQSRVEITYVLESRALSPNTLYFHALYGEKEKTVGYEQYRILGVQGEGLFVGMNLFDSGHNHGGGDAALIDAGTASPRVLHGVCGEDYFGFAWHHFGTMTPLIGAPVHERRYRLHLENPYPFHESIQVLFGVFAGQHPKSVAFWYQLPKADPESEWRTFDVPWKTLGPLGIDTSVPDTVSDASYETVVPINAPTKLTATWQGSEMRSGFLDATYQFRHYVLIDHGTGFIAGASKTQLLTYVYSPSQRELRLLAGHDDPVLVRLNDETNVELPAHAGFKADPLILELHRGWNKLALSLYNDENVNWRWCGVSLAFDREQSQGLRFASRPE